MTNFHQSCNVTARLATGLKPFFNSDLTFWAWQPRVSGTAVVLDLRRPVLRGWHFRGGWEGGAKTIWHLWSDDGTGCGGITERE